VIERFELPWMGGVAEHHLRQARPEVDDLPWAAIDTAAYAPAAVARARVAWTEVAINEYRAAAAFTEVVHALLDTKAPLDLIAMACDFLGDECAHVEMASRLAMALGGGVERLVDVERFAVRPRGLTAFQRANELVLRTSCIDEAFTGGTAGVSLESTSHPLVRAVYTAILRDEARHRRLGGLYFEWALRRIDEAESRRLGEVLYRRLCAIRSFWTPSTDAARAPQAEPVNADTRALGWLEEQTFQDVAREVVVRDILDPLATIGIAIAPEQRRSLLDSEPSSTSIARATPEGPSSPGQSS
jgi:hypothetical protein